MSNSNNFLRSILRFPRGLSKGAVRSRLVVGTIIATLVSASGAFQQRGLAQTLAPVDVVADRYHASVAPGIPGNGNTRFGAFQVVTDGLSTTAQSGPDENHFDTFPARGLPARRLWACNTERWST